MTVDDPHTPSVGYAYGRLARALETAAGHADPQARTQALDKVARWREVISGMTSGSLAVGSRTPVADTPAWVTLEVIHGGFATGRYEAEGPLLDHEREQLARLQDSAPGGTDREKLNRYYLSDEGQQKLLEALDSGAYSISVPEEGGLLTVVWLLNNGHEPDALDLLAQLEPYFARLRFYPKLEALAQPPGTLVRRRTLGSVKAKLDRVVPQPGVAAMRESLGVWNPLYDRLITLWLDTVEGDAPRLQNDRVVGGVPGLKLAVDWWQRRDAWLKDYEDAASKHKLCGKHRHPKSNFGRLQRALAKVNRLESREAGWVRRALANALSKRGMPEGDTWNAVRLEQSAQLQLPTREAQAKSLIEALDGFRDDGGLAETASLLEQIAGKLRPSFEAKLNMALEASIPELIEKGVVGSAEVLAEVLPQLTSQVIAAGLQDPALRRLFGQVYSAFRKRRSLLLLNYESQVRLDELPWVQALSQHRTGTMEAGSQARQLLEDASLLALSGFPQTILPNPFVAELLQLAKQADLKLPLVNEIAADIFMGKFLPKWSRAAEIAWEHLRETPYARYYDLTEVPSDFSALCVRRSSEAGEGGRGVARNGAVIEQSQILTTHNLAVVTFELGIEAQVRGMASELCVRAFDFVVDRQNRPTASHYARLQMIKNTAYAWRQSIFFLSLVSPDAQAQVISHLQDRFLAGPAAWQTAFRPAFDGLLHVVGGGRFSETGRGPNDSRRFLGWSCGHHWLMAGLSVGAAV